MGISDKLVSKSVEEIVVNSQIIAAKYGPNKTSEALRGLAESFEKDYRDSFDITKSDFGFNKGHLIT